MALVIVGLGNPGKEYEKTRHNAGRSAVQLVAKNEGFDAFIFNKKANALVSRGVFEGHDVSTSDVDTSCPSVNAMLVLPETMMNVSGKTVSMFIKSPKAAKNLLVIHDDLDLPLGTLKMVFARGSGGHKGVESVMRAIKTKDFARIRIGIAPTKNPASAKATAGKQAKKLKDEEKVIKHVLGKWKPAEEAAFKKVLKKVAEATRLFATSGLASATQFVNTR
ncbi:MAG: aminoacyl-tRNA hydrolase [Patescibacteria group bacterium]